MAAIRLAGMCAWAVAAVPIEAVGRVLRSLGHPGQTTGVSLDEAATWLRSALAAA